MHCMPAVNRCYSPLLTAVSPLLMLLHCGPQFDAAGRGASAAFITIIIIMLTIITLVTSITIIIINDNMITSINIF